MRLENKVVMVPGGASGLGFAMAVKFLAEGSHTIIADMHEPAVGSAVEALSESGGAVSGVVLDVTNRKQVHAAHARPIGDVGRVDVMVSNAGLTRYRSFSEIDDGDWDAVLGVHLKGVPFCSRVAARHMTERRYGKIISISSAAGTGTTPHVAAGSPGDSSPHACPKAVAAEPGGSPTDEKLAGEQPGEAVAATPAMSSVFN